MRAFHYSWWGFFIAFFIWFAIAPLLSEVQISLGLTKQELWTSSIAGVGGTIFMRFLLGPMCDKFGPRIPFSMVLCFASIPTAMTGFVSSATGLAVLRFFIGLAGSTFVTYQYWSSRWGNLGGGVTQLVMGSVLFPLFKVFFDGDAEKAWRSVSVVPAVVAFASGIMIYTTSEDCPKGNYGPMKKKGLVREVSAAGSFSSGALNFNNWLLFVQYACCFGLELTMNNASTLYFKEKFGLTTETAAAIASIFGWMNLFARGLGGLLSDFLNSKMGMRGRILAQTVCLLLEGVLVLIFANSNTLGGSIVVLVIFSLFVQASEGTSYGIVPYVDPPKTGTIAGIIGAGGNTGAVCFGLGFRNLEVKPAFYIMGISIIACSLLSVFVFLPGHAGLVCGEDDPSKQNFKLSLANGEGEKAVDNEKSVVATTEPSKVLKEDSEELYA